MRQAVELLISLGHRRIAYIGSPSSHLFYGEVERAYIEALRDAGIGVDCALITRHRTHGIPQVIAGQHMGHRLMQMTERPTAIVAARDAFAEGAWYAIEEHGLTVGRDVSLVGYDDHSASAHCRELTTFHEPCYELGAKAVEMLVDRIVNNHTTPQQVELKSKLVMRRSAGPANN
jgi:LacI family transcriptional regulator